MGSEEWPSGDPPVELVGFGDWIYAWQRGEVAEDEPWAGLGPHVEFAVRCGGRNYHDVVGGEGGTALTAKDWLYLVAVVDIKDNRRGVKNAWTERDYDQLESAIIGGILAVQEDRRGCDSC